MGYSSRAGGYHYEASLPVLPGWLRGRGAVYAATDLLVTGPVELRIRVAGASAHRLFIDSQLAVAADRFRERPPLAQAVQARLAPGRHRLLVKMVGPDKQPAVAKPAKEEKPKKAGTKAKTAAKTKTAKTKTPKKASKDAKPKKTKMKRAKAPAKGK